MEENNKNIDDNFVEEFIDSPKKSGKLIKNLIKNNFRPLLNLPFYGKARKISSELKDEPFSFFYIFERTMAHKLHPNLYKLELNLITDNRIEKHFKDKYQTYERNIPASFKITGSADPDQKMKKMLLLKDLITDMAKKDGHFMVIKFYDYFVKKIDEDISNILRSMEFAINHCKKWISNDNNKNIDMIKKRCQTFIDKYGEENRGLLIERMEWDNILKDYSKYLKKENENQKDNNVPIDEKIIKYAGKIKEAYLNEISGDDAGDILKIIDSVFENNKKKFDDEKAEKIVKDILNIWLDDETINIIKKDQLQKIYDERYGTSLELGNDNSSDAADRLDGELNGGSSSKNDSLSESEVSESYNGEFDIKSDGTDIDPDEFDIKAEEPDSDLDEFDIKAEDAGSDSDEFDIKVEEPDSDLDEFDIKAEEPNNDPADFDINADEDGSDELGNFLISKKDELDVNLKQIEKYVENARGEISELKQIDDPEKLVNKITEMLSDEIYRENLEQLLLMVKELENDENIIIKIIRYLEGGPFKVMTYNEKTALIDTFIEKFKDNEKVVLQLENYKKTLNKPNELLNSVFNKLTEIEKERREIKVKISRQLEYLNSCLNDEDYKPVWISIKTIYENIINQHKEVDVSDTFKKFAHEPHWKQAGILNFLKEFYSEKKDILQVIQAKLDSDELGPFVKRLDNEKNGEQVNLENVLNEVIGGGIKLNRFIENVIQDENGSEANMMSTLRKTLKSFLSNKDLSESENINHLKKLVNKIILTNPEEALKYLEPLLNSSEIDIQAKEVILNSYRESKDQLLQSMSRFHKLVDSHDDIDDKEKIINEFIDIFSTQKVPDFVNGLVSQKIRSVHDEEKNLKESKKLIAEIDNVPDEEKSSFVDKMASDPGHKEKVRSVARGISDASDTDKFNEAFTAITYSTNSPEMKMKFLETLKIIALEKNIDSPNIDKETIDSRKKRINDKIEFYKKIISHYHNEKKTYKGKREEIIESVKKGMKTKKPEVKSDKSIKKKKKKTEKSVPDEKSMSNEEKIKHQTVLIIKAFNDNADAVEPVMNTLINMNAADNQKELVGLFQDVKNQRTQLIKNTEDMIKTGSANPDLIKKVHKSSPKMQYLWGESIKENMNLTNLEDAFKVFEKDKESYNDIIRLVKVIKSNNKNDFLKKSVEKDDKLVSNILQDFTAVDLKRLKSKTTGSKEKEKINLFRDFLKLTDDSQLSAIGDEYKAQVKKSSEAGAGKKKNDEKKEMNDTNGEKTSEEKETGREIVTEITNFINLNKSERTRKMAVGNNRRNTVLNSFLSSLATGEESAVAIVRKHRDDCIDLFRDIIKFKLQNIYTLAGPALKYCIDSKIIEKTDLIE